MGCVSTINCTRWAVRLSEGNNVLKGTFAIRQCVFYLSLCFTDVGGPLPLFKGDYHFKVHDYYNYHTFLLPQSLPSLIPCLPLALVLPPTQAIYVFVWGDVSFFSLIFFLNFEFVLIFYSFYIPTTTAPLSSPPPHPPITPQKG